MSNVSDLTAEEVKRIVEASGGSTQQATRTYPISVSIYERFGRAYINWALDPNFPIGDSDCVQLREGDTLYTNYPVKELVGTVDTGHVFGSGLTASYWAISYAGTSNWRQLVLTPKT